MKTGLSHLQLNVSRDNLGFYAELSEKLGWSTDYAGDEVLLVTGSNGVSIGFVVLASSAITNDYDGPGMNHIAFSAESQGDVDEVAGWLTEKKIAPLFETPRHRSEFSDETSTYYQVMFETPDRILVEVVYAGPKHASD